MATIQEQLLDIQGQLRRGAQTDYLLTLNKLEKSEFDAFKTQIQNTIGSIVQEIASFSFGTNTIQSLGDVLTTLGVTGQGEYLLAVADDGTFTYDVVDGSGATVTTQLDVVAGQSVIVKTNSLGAVSSAQIVQVGGTGGSTTPIDWNQPYTQEFADQINALQTTNPTLYAQLAGYILPNP